VVLRACAGGGGLVGDQYFRIFEYKTILIHIRVLRSFFFQNVPDEFLSRFGGVRGREPAVLTEESIMAEFDHELDARGLNCPLPILRAKKALNDLSGGQVLRILATDPGSVKDFEAFAQQTGNELVESKEANGEFHFLLRKKS